MSAKKLKASPAIAVLRLEAIFHPKFENELPDADVRRKMLARVSAGEGYLEASLKHSGSLLLWSGGQRFYSKNATCNVFTRVGEIMLMKHFARCYGEGWREEYKRCSKYVEEKRLTCSFEVVTSILGHHGDIPKRDYLILIAVADRSNGGEFYSTNEVVKMAHTFRLPHNDAWMFSSGAACEELFRSYDEMWETGTATTVISRLDQIVSKNEGECAKVSSLYPHDLFQGEILEGIVIRYVPYASFAGVAKDGASILGRSVNEMRELGAASNELLKLVPPSNTPIFEDRIAYIGDMIVRTDLRAQADRLDMFSEMVVETHHGRSKARTVQRWDSHAEEDSDESTTPTCINVSNIANEILSSSSAYYDKETLDIARLIQTLDLLKVHVSYKLLIEKHGEESEPRYLCILHVHHDSSFPKYNAFLKREGLDGMPLFRGFSIEFVPEKDDVGDGVKLEGIFSETTTADAKPRPNNEEKLMLKMKFLPYMVRTFICRNGLSVLQSSGIAAFEHHAVAQLTKWKASDSSVSKWMPFFKGWARYCSSPSEELPPLTEKTYLHHYNEFDNTMFAEGKFRSSETEEASFHGLIIIVGPCRDDLENLAAALSKQLHCSRVVRNQNNITDKDVLLSMQPSGGGVICIAEIEDGYKALRRLAKEYHEVMHVIMVESDLEEIAGSDKKRLQKLKGMSQGWTKLRCNLTLELPNDAAAQADIDATLEYLQNAPPAKAVVEKLFECSKSKKQPDERPGLIVYFPSIPGSGKSSLCKGITADALGIEGDRQLILLEGDQVRNRSNGKFYSVVEKEVLSKPASVAILDKNVPPASFSSIHSLSMDSKSFAVPVYPSGLQDTVVGAESLSHVYPFALQYLAACMSRVMRREPSSHKGKLDSATENACMVVVKFYCFYRNLTAAALKEKLQSIGHQHREIVVPFFRETALPDLPTSLRAALEEAVTLQTREDMNIGTKDGAEMNGIEKRLRTSIEEHRGYIDSLTVALEQSHEAFLEGLSSAIASLPEKLEVSKADESLAGTIEIASLDIDFATVHRELEQLQVGCPEVEQYFSERREHRKNDENDKTLDRFITSTHCTFAHASQASHADMLASFQHLVGTAVEVKATSILFSDKIAAIELEIPHSESIPRPRNEFPHITIWCAKDTEAYESNDLPEKVKCNEAKRVAFGRPIALEGVFSFWYY